MARIVQFRRGTTTSLSTILGAPGELFVDTSLVTVVVHDGVTTGGVTLARNADITSLSSNVNTRITNVTSQTIATTSLSIGSSVSTLWNFAQSSNGSLYLYFNGVAKIRFDTSGTISAVSNVGAFVTI
jgi:hypothetical protein